MLKIMLKFYKSPHTPNEILLNRILSKNGRLAEFPGCLGFYLNPVTKKVHLQLEQSRFLREEQIIKDKQQTFYYATFLQTTDLTPLSFIVQDEVNFSFEDPPSPDWEENEYEDYEEEDE